MTDITIRTDLDDATTLIAEEASEALGRAAACAVTSDATYREAGEELRIVKTIAKRLDEARRTLKAPVLEAGRRIDALFVAPLDACGAAEKTLKGAMLAYTSEQERQRKAEAERVRRELEEQERARRAAEAERRRAEEAARDLEGFGPAVEPEPVPEPVAVSVVTPATTVARAAGVSTRTLYRARVVDKLALIRAAAAGDELALAVLTVDERALATLATSRKGTLAMPGVEFFEEQTLAARSA